MTWVRASDIFLKGFLVYENQWDSISTLLSTDYPPGYAPGDANSKNLIGSAKGKNSHEIREID